MFYSYTPTKILNGIGALKAIPRELSGIDELVIIHGESLEQFDGVVLFFKQTFGHEKVQFIKIPAGDPTIQGVEHVSKQVIAKSPFLIGLGGGRVLDFTKALAVYLGNGFTGDELFNTSHFSWDKTLKLAVVATRPGSGSESNNAFILANKEGWKTSLFSLFTYPEFCVHDPAFFETLGSEAYRLGLFDALIHVLDQFVVDREASLIVDGLALSYLKMLGQLAQFGKKPDWKHYQQLAWLGAMISSGILTRGVDASWRCHELAHALASVIHVSHGRSLAFLAASVFEQNCASPNRYQQAMNSFFEGYELQAQQSLAYFVSNFFEGPIHLKLPEDTVTLSTKLASQCPNYSAKLIEDIIRNSRYE